MNFTGKADRIEGEDKWIEICDEYEIEDEESYDLSEDLENDNGSLLEREHTCIKPFRSNGEKIRRY